jgi:TPR repeat protein
VNQVILTKCLIWDYITRKKHDYDSMTKYYLIAIEHGNANAMNNLGYYYNENKNYNLMIK